MTQLFLFDVRVDPVSSLPWGGLIVLLVIAFVLAVSIVVGLVLFLLWWKRRKLRNDEMQVRRSAPMTS